MHRTSDRQAGRQAGRKTSASCHSLTGDGSLYTGMGVAGKRERTWSPARPPLGTLSFV